MAGTVDWDEERFQDGRRRGLEFITAALGDETGAPLQVETLRVNLEDLIERFEDTSSISLEDFLREIVPLILGMTRTTVELVATALEVGTRQGAREMPEPLEFVRKFAVARQEMFPE